jgi:hypothetical protein
MEELIHLAVENGLKLQTLEWKQLPNQITWSNLLREPKIFLSNSFCLISPKDTVILCHNSIIGLTSKLFWDLIFE